MKTKIKDPLFLFILIAPFMRGLPGIAGSAVLMICSAAYLISLKHPLVYRNRYSVAAPVMLASAFIPVITDRAHGDAFLGWFRLLAYALAILVLMNHNESDVFTAIPLSGALMVIISAVCYLTPAKGHFFESHRLAGSFQYSNTMALFLLIGIIILLERDHTVLNDIMLAILSLGIMWTGSRFTYLLTIACLVWYLIRKSGRLRNIIILAAFVIVPLAAIAFSSGRYSFGRILTLSASSSTFLGRILYWKDALPVIARHPFGLGFNGYYHLEYTIQHGVYSIRNVHNEYLQIALDYGWIPLAAFIYMIINGIHDSHGINRLILLIIAVHCLLDFDLNYAVICLIIVMCIDVRHGQKAALPVSRLIVCIPCIAVAAWFFTGYALNYSGQYRRASDILPLSSDIAEQAMMNTESASYATRQAKRLITSYPLYYRPYGVLSDACYLRISEGDYSDYDEYLDSFNDMLSYRWRSIRYAPYNYDSVVEFQDLLKQLRSLGDDELTSLSETYKKRTDDLMEKIRQTTDPIAYKLRDKPFTSGYQASMQ